MDMWARTTWRRHFGATMKCCKGDLFQMINSNCLAVCVCSDTEFIWLHARYILMVRFVLFLHSSFLFGNVVHWAMSLKFMDMDIFNCLWWRWLGEVTLILDKTCEFLWWEFEIMKFIHFVCPTGDFESRNGGVESLTTLTCTQLWRVDNQVTVEVYYFVLLFPD